MNDSFEKSLEHQKFSLDHFQILSEQNQDNMLSQSHWTTDSMNYSQSIKINIGPSHGGTIIPSFHRSPYYIEDRRSSVEKKSLCVIIYEMKSEVLFTSYLVNNFVHSFCAKKIIARRPFGQSILVFQTIYCESCAILWCLPRQFLGGIGSLKQTYLNEQKNILESFRS